MYPVVLGLAVLALLFCIGSVVWLTHRPKPSSQVPVTTANVGEHVLAPGAWVGDQSGVPFDAVPAWFEHVPSGGDLVIAPTDSSQRGNDLSVGQGFQSVYASGRVPVIRSGHGNGQQRLIVVPGGFGSPYRSATPPPNESKVRPCRVTQPKIDWVTGKPLQP